MCPIRLIPLRRYRDAEARKCSSMLARWALMRPSTQKATGGWRGGISWWMAEGGATLKCVCAPHAH